MTEPPAGQEPPSPPLPPIGPHLWQIRAVRDLIYILFFAALIFFGYYLRSIFSPLLVGLVLAYIFNPLIIAMQRKWRIGRVTAISILLTVVLLAGLIISGLLLNQLIGLATAAPTYLNSMTERFGDYLADWGIQKADIEAQVNTYAEAIKEDPKSVLIPAFKAVFAGTGQVADLITGVLGATTYFLLTLFLIPVYFFYFAWRLYPIVEGARRYIPASTRTETLAVLRKMDSAIAAFVRTRVLISFLMGILFFIGWKLVGVPYAFLLGMGTGLLSVIPFLGGIGWPIAILLAYVSGVQTATTMGEEFSLWSVLIWPTVVFWLVQAIEGWVLVPLLQGRSLNLDSVTIIVVVFIGSAVGGLYGLILCIPIAACIRILLTDVALPRLRRWAQSQ